MRKFSGSFLLLFVFILLSPILVSADKDENNEVKNYVNLDELTEEELQYVPKAQRDGNSFDDSHLHSDTDADLDETPNTNESYPDVNEYIESHDFETASTEYDHIDFLPVFPYRNGYGAVEGVVAHETANDGSTIESEINWMKDNYENAFVHAFVDHERVIETHPTENAAWGAGPVANERFVHVELVRVHNFDDFAKSIDNYTSYIADILYDYQLGVDSAEEDGKGTLWSHKAVTEFLGGTNHVDPHGYFSKYGYVWDDFVELVEEKYEQNIDLERISGKDRYATSVDISQKGWDKSDAVMLARGDEYADALAGVPLAKVYDAPMLLTQPEKLTETTKAEISRLGTEKVYVLGEEKAISKDIEQKLLSMGMDVERVAGSDRTHTAAKIAEKMPMKNADNQAVLVNGYDFPDALSVASYAAQEEMPILLSQTDKLPDATHDAISDLGIDKTIVIGGEKVVSSKIKKALPKSKRLSGSDRFDTAVELAKHFPEAKKDYYVTTGMEFPDALAGAALAAKEHTGILLVHGNLPDSVSDFILDENMRDVNIIGGTNAVSKRVEGLIKDHLRQ